jgi:Na+/glutamate symporter
MDVTQKPSFFAKIHKNIVFVHWPSLRASWLASPCCPGYCGQAPGLSPLCVTSIKGTNQQNFLSLRFLFSLLSRL